jgi:deoxyribonuclease-4
MRKRAKANEAKTKSRHAPRLGFHAPIAGGLQNALLKSRERECDAVQIFSRNPRGWTARALSAEEIENFQRVRRETRIEIVAIHANYLLNLATSDATIRAKSIAAFREEIERGLHLKADYIVLHPGSARGACEADAVRLCAESLRAACEDLPLNEKGATQVLIENTAGQGDCIGYRFEHLRDIIAACPGLNLGVCFDTAHAFEAGYDLRDEEKFAATMKHLDECVGLGNVRVVHFNDSKTDFDSRVDRHWHIGEGKIGCSGLRRVAQFPKLQRAAFLLETPQDDPEADAANLAKLRSFIRDE